MKMIKNISSNIYLSILVIVPLIRPLFVSWPRLFRHKAHDFVHNKNAMYCNWIMFGH